MKGTYFLVAVVDDSYMKDGVNKPYFSHYFRDADGKILVRKASVKMCDDLPDELLEQFPRVVVTVKEVTTAKGSYIALEKVEGVSR